MFEPANCSVAPATTRSDAGVAGAGVLLSFIITASLALTLSGAIILSELRGPATTPRQLTIVRKLLGGYSDQQIATGIGIQAVGLARVSSTVPYHFFIIWMLSLLSMAVHNATLLALVRDFRRDWVLRWLRQGLMAANLALSCVYGVFVLRAVSVGLDASTLPVECVWRPDAAGSGSGTNVGVSFAGTIAVIAGNCATFGLATWYLHSRSQRWYRIIQVVGLFLMVAVAIGAAVRVVLLSQAFGTPSVPLSDEGEKEWSFGQLLGMLFLFLPVISVIEIARGDVKVKPPVADDEDRLPLTGAELQERPSRVRSSFQPNPFFGSQTSLVKR